MGLSVFRFDFVGCISDELFKQVQNMKTTIHEVTL